MNVSKVQQRYISKELTHFVDASIKDEDQNITMGAQYDLLIKIIRDRRISYPPHDCEDIIPPDLKYDPYYSYRFDFRFDASSNEMINPDMVCFCDIPIEDLGIHIQKYSPFGLSFPKSFLIERGVNPVFYIARSSGIHGITRGEYFNDRIKLYLKTCSKYDPATSSGKDCSGVIGFINDMLCSLKFFDPERTDEDKDNFYMEREWRSLFNIHFEIKHIERIIIPKSFAERFRNDVPDYFGQITFSDDHIVNTPKRDVNPPIVVCTPK
jgi:hypothetical protein